jgi:sec-independent protein translocase protein TatC
VKKTPPNDIEMPLLEHLVELRDRLLYSVISIFVSTLVCFYFANDIWNFLVAPLNEALEQTGKGTMAVHDVFEGIITQIKIALMAGVLVSSPISFYQGWKFVYPALTRSESQFIFPLSIASTLLFLLGISFGYFVIFQFIFPFFLEITSSDIEAVLSINAYLNTATKLLLAFGLSFQLPIIVFFLSRAGLIDHLDMINSFRYAIVVILILSALLTPPDPLSQVLMALPLLVLYIVGIALSYFFSTKTREEPSTD